MQRTREIITSEAFQQYEREHHAPYGWGRRERVKRYLRYRYNQEKRTIREHYRDAKKRGTKFITDINDPRLALILNEVEKHAKAEDWCDEFNSLMAWLGGPRASRMD